MQCPQRMILNVHVFSNYLLQVRLNNSNRFRTYSLLRLANRSISWMFWCELKMRPNFVKPSLNTLKFFNLEMQKVNEIMPTYIVALVFNFKGGTSKPTGWMYELLQFDFAVYPSCNLEQSFKFPDVISFPRFNLIMRANKFPNI